MNWSGINFIILFLLLILILRSCDLQKKVNANKKSIETIVKLIKVEPVKVTITIGR